DFLYRNTRLPGGRALEGELWYQQSDTEGLEGDDGAAGITLRVPSTNGFRGGVGLRELESNFHPALGFVDRRGVRSQSFDVGYTYRPGRGAYVQSVFWSLDGERVDLIDGGLQTEALALRLF